MGDNIPNSNPKICLDHILIDQDARPALSGSIIYHISSIFIMMIEKAYTPQEMFSIFLKLLTFGHGAMCARSNYSLNIQIRNAYLIELIQDHGQDAINWGRAGVVIYNESDPLVSAYHVF